MKRFRGCCYFSHVRVEEPETGPVFVDEFTACPQGFPYVGFLGKFVLYFLRRFFL